jgi:hypothetical protein
VTAVTPPHTVAMCVKLLHMLLALLIAFALAFELSCDAISVLQKYNITDGLLCMNLMYESIPLKHAPEMVYIM